MSAGWMGVVMSKKTTPYRETVIAVLLLSLCLCPSPGVGQVLYGSLTGNISDPSNAALIAARVEALNISTGVLRTATADDDGNYLNFQFRTEWFSATNTPHFTLGNFNSANTNVTSSQFGQINSTLAGNPGSRQIWFAGKLSF